MTVLAPSLVLRPAAIEPVACVGADSFLTLHYRVAAVDGDALVDTFDGGAATLSLGTGELAPALEARLAGMAAGDEASFELAAGEAFGERHDALVQRLSRAWLAEVADPEEIYEVGDVVRFPAPGSEASIAGIVRAVDAAAVTFDFNHPLAGRAVRFDVRIVAIL